MPNVLVVDSSPVDQKIIARLLEHLPDLRLVFTRNGEEGLNQLKQNDFHVVLTDLVIPGFDGFDLLTHIMSHYPLTPVILMTNVGNEAAAVKALQLGASGYLPKKSLNENLVDTIENVLDESRAERERLKLLDCIEKSDFSFVLENDANMFPPLISFLHRSVRAVGLCDETSGIHVCVSLEEALNNALFHGNLELDSLLRDGDQKTYHNLAAERRVTDPYCRRKIYVDVKVTAEEGCFVVRDEGPGFDPQLVPDPTAPENLEKSSGRGLLLMKTFMDDVRHNKLGNQVTMIKRSAHKEARE
ncbi:MAG: ATP-binding protein [Pirellulaceae bacterium]|nr:ATP-binding protein [Pirellulaceae bacterium]